LKNAARPLLAEVERDREARQVVAAIRKLRAATPRDPPLVVPPSCRPGRNRMPARARATSIDGTYRSTPTTGRAPAAVVTWTLRAGVWTSTGAERNMGTYTVRGRRVAFDWPRVGAVLTFDFTRDPDGTLHLNPVPPIAAEDARLWAGAPWRRLAAP
jgi:hypothetical protein